MTSSTAFETPDAVACEADERVKTDFGLRDAPDAGKPSKPPVAGKSRFESDNDFDGVVCVLDAKTRVIACSDGVQWSIQRRNKAGWQSQYYFRSKSGLLFYAKSDAPDLLRLPDWFPERGAGEWEKMWARPFSKPELL